MDIDWNKAPEGAEAKGLSPCHERSAWLLSDGYRYEDNGEYFNYAEGFGRDMFTCVELRPQPWTGDGFPPVGTVCDFLDLRGGVKRDWCEVEVMYLSDVTLVVKPARPIDGQAELTLHPHTAEFRAIRTLEQIAWDDMKKVTAEMLAVFKSNYEGSLMDGIQALYFDGYRKQVAP